METIATMLDSVRVATSLIMDEAARVAQSPKDRKVSSGVLAQVRLAINKVEQASLQELADSYEPRRRAVSRTDLEMRALAAIMNGTDWLSAAEIGRELDPNAANPHATASRWLQNKQVFAIDHRGKKMFPAYVFGESWKPVPEIKKVLAVLEGYSPLRLASWFESTNAALQGRRPREVVKGDPKAVIRAAERQVVGAVHG
ncbi:hypothetical protein QTH87_25650 [Variovorax sp. J22P168]|nr:hypothetical protein [Variovorax sp. J22P168]